MEETITIIIKEVNQIPDWNNMVSSLATYGGYFSDNGNKTEATVTAKKYDPEDHILKSVYVKYIFHRSHFKHVVADVLIFKEEVELLNASKKETSTEDKTTVSPDNDVQSHYLKEWKLLQKQQQKKRREEDDLASPP